MRLLLLILLCVSSPLGAQDADTPVGDLAFIEITTSKDTYFVQEPISLRLRLGVESEFLKTNVIQLFRQKLDVPVRIEADWFSDLPGTVILEDIVDDAAVDNRPRRSLVLNDTLAQAVLVPSSPDSRGAEREFTVLEIERRYLPDEPGRLEISGPVLRFSSASQFREDFLNGRVPVDRRDAAVFGKPLTLEILPLPTVGQPPEFTGAVGRFSVSSETDSRAVQAGQSFKLTLHIHGEGNMEFLEPPRLDDLEGFHVFGKIEDSSKSGRAITFDLAALSDTVEEVPAIPFAYFDPSPPVGYRTVSTQPIPLHVQPSAGATGLQGAPGGETGVPGENDIFNIRPVEVPSTDPARSLSPVLLVALLLLPWVVVLGLLYRRRVLRNNQVDPADLRAQNAAAEFRSRMDTPDTDVAEAMAEYLSAHLRCPVAAVIAPELPTALAAAGVSSDLAARTGRLLHELVDARFGGSAPPDSAEDARQLVEALEAIFQGSDRVR